MAYKSKYTTKDSITRKTRAFVKDEYNEEVENLIKPSNSNLNSINKDNTLHGIPLDIFQANDNLKCSAVDLINTYQEQMSTIYNKYNKTLSVPGFLKKTWNAYLSNGCSWWETRLNALTLQLTKIKKDTVTYDCKNAEKNFINILNTNCGCNERIPPSGYSYTSKGSLVKTEALNLYKERVEKRIITGKKEESIKIIKSFNINTDDLDPNGEIRSFTITGDDGAMFSMEVYDADNNYYNFSNKTWSSTKSKLGKTIIKNKKYQNIINFSNIASKTHVYTILLFAEDTRKVKTEHSVYQERRKIDNSIDINSSKGSNSKLIKKTISQQQGVSLRLSAIAPSKGDYSTDTVDGAVSSGTNIVMDTSYLVKKIYIGDKVSGTNIAAGTTIAAVNVSDTLDRYTLSTAVSGTVSDGATLTFTSPFSAMTPDYDTTTGSALISGLSTGVNNIKKYFTITLTAPSGRSFMLNRQPVENDIATINLVTFGASALAIDGENTSSDTVFYRFPATNIAGLGNDMILDPRKRGGGTNTTIGSFISDYTTTTTVTTEEVSGYKEEEQIEKYKELEKDEAILGSEESFTVEEVTTQVFIPGVEKTGSPTINRAGIVTAQAGNITFNKQQLDALKADTSVQIFGYGLQSIKQMSFGTSLKFSNLKAELSEKTTTTTSWVSNSTSIPIAERAGIFDGVSFVSGPGITTPVRVVSGASGNTGAGTIVVASAQTIDSGQTLTFSKSSNVITITGDVEILNMAESDTTIYFDVERFITCY